MNERDTHPNCHQGNFESGQPVQSEPHQDPSVPSGRTSNNIQSNSHFEPHNGGAYYGMTPYDQQHPPTNLELRVPGIPAGPTFYNRHFNPSSGSRIYPGHVNNVPADHLPSSSNHRGNAVPMDDYARNNTSVDGLRASYKRKNAEAIPGNAQHYNVPAGPSSSISSVTSLSVIPAMDASYPASEYRGNGLPSNIQDAGRNLGIIAGPHRDSVWTQNYNHGVQGNFMVQPFQPSRLVWMDQQSIHNSGGGGALPWNLMPLVPCYLGSNIPGGPSEVANAGPRGYHGGTARRGPGNFMHSAPMINQPLNLLPAHCIQGIRGFPISFHPPLAAMPAVHPLNNPAQGSSLSNSSADGEATSGFRMYRPHGRPDTIPRHRNMPYLTILPADEVAILEIPGLTVAGNVIDQHSDMRMNIDDMSYEDLLALGEQIGSVHPLSDENIADHLKTRLYSSVSGKINLEELPSLDQNVDLCIICQDQYQENDRLGCLDCEHQFHNECLKKWLKLKNVCPICKSTALSM